MRQNVLKVVSRHTLSITSSVEPWNTDRHRMRQELTRAFRNWQSRCQEAVFLLMRGCALGTPANKDTRIKVEYVHVEKESDDGRISIRDRTPLQSKKNNLHLTFHRSRHSQRTGEDTMPKHAHLVVIHFRSGETRREQREESLRIQHVPKFGFGSDQRRNRRVISHPHRRRDSPAMFQVGRKTC